MCDITVVVQYTHGWIKKMKVRERYIGAWLRLNGVQHSLVTCLFEDDRAAGGVKMLQKMVDVFYIVCKRRKSKVNTGKSKVMLF